MCHNPDPSITPLLWAEDRPPSPAMYVNTEGMVRLGGSLTQTALSWGAILYNIQETFFTQKPLIFGQLQ